MNKILITGASGFVGSNLTGFLEKKLYNVIPFSRKLGLNYNLIDSNFLNQNKVETIIHLAGKTDDLKHTSNVQEYYKVNVDLTIKIYNAFLDSDSNVFIYFSSVKAVNDHFDKLLLEDEKPNPISVYGKSKLAAENYILNKLKETRKRIYILRPTLIYGYGNHGNLNMLFKYNTIGVPWPLGSFDNKRSYCGIENLLFVINELIIGIDVPSGIYNVADDCALSTNELIRIISKFKNKPIKILKIPKKIILSLSKIGDFFNLPFNTEVLKKLTTSNVVSNQKIKKAIGKKLPVSSLEGFINTFTSMSNK